MKIKNIIIYIIILIALCGVSVYATYTIEEYKHNEEQNNNVVNNTDDNKAESTECPKVEECKETPSTSVNDRILSKANELMNTFNILTTTGGALYDNEYGEDYWSYFYTFDKLENKDVSEKVKLGLTINKWMQDKYGIESYDYETLEKISNELLSINEYDKVYISLFGSKPQDYSINTHMTLKRNLNPSEAYPESGLYTNGIQPIYDKENNRYEFRYGGLGGTTQAEVANEIEKVEYNRSNKTLIIQSKAMFVVHGFYDNVYIFKDAKFNNNDISKCPDDPNITEMKVSDLACLYNLENQITHNPKSTNIKDYYDKINSYKWTFKENSNGDFVFESIEKLVK